MELSEMQFLVAEDHDFQRRSLVRMLGDLGAKQVLEAADGRGALDYFSDLTQPLDVIICDLDMPGMDGMELIRHIGKSGAPASIILTSALDHTLISSVGEMARAYGINVIGVIDKPANPAKLLELIRLHGGNRDNIRRAAPGTMRFSAGELRSALQAGQFVPCYQPQVEFAGGRLAGVEVRARWRHPELGLLSPAQFAEPLVAAGLTGALTRTMIESAAQARAAWARAGLDLTAALALPAQMLDTPTIAADLAAWIAPSGSTPRNITLEITDLGAASSTPAVLENLARLRIRDFGIAVEDGGAGTCSVQFLTRSPFTCLKIGREVVHDAARQERLRQIIEARIAMAARLDFRTIACQIGNRHEWDRLASLGCNLAQGDFIAPAMEAAAIPAWASRWTLAD